MDSSVITAVGLLLTPLGVMASAIFGLLIRRIGRLEKQNGNLIGYVLTTCTEKSENMEKLADLISRSGGEG